MSKRKRLQAEVIELIGSPYEIGVKQGSILKLNQKFKERYDLQTHSDVKEATQRLEEVSPSLLLELKGLAAGLGVGEDTSIQRWSGYDIAMPAMGCTTLANAAFYARNYDFSDDLYDARLVVSKPDHGYASIGFSQQIIGRLDGMNEKGVVVGLHLVNENVSQKGFLATTICRLILDQCATTEEAIALIKQVPHQYCFNFSIMDKSGMMAKVEATPEEQIVRYMSPLVCTNHFESESLTNKNREYIDGSLHRKKYLQSLEKENVTAVAAYEIFNDERSPLFFKYYKEYFGTLHTVVYCPEDSCVIIGIGGDCKPYVLRFGDWLSGNAKLPNTLEGMIEA